MYESRASVSGDSSGFMEPLDFWDLVQENQLISNYANNGITWFKLIALSWKNAPIIL